MNVIYENLQSKKFSDRRAIQFTLDKDFNIPDNLGDISEIVGFSKQLTVADVENHGNSDKQYVRGELKFQILFYTEDEKKLSSFDGVIGFDELLRIDGSCSGSRQLEALLEDMKISIIHPRKVSVTALAAIASVCLSDDESSIISRVDEDNIVEALYDDIMFCRSLYTADDTIDINDEITLSKNLPNINKILLSSCSITDFGLEVKENSFKIYGRLSVFIIYEGEAEDDAANFSNDLYFEKEIAVTGINYDCIVFSKPSLRCFTASIIADEENEPRCIGINGTLCCNTDIRQNMKAGILRDAYTCYGDLTCEKSDMVFDTLCSCLNEVFKINEILPAHSVNGKINEIINCEAKIIPDEAVIDNQGLHISGTIDIDLYGVNRCTDSPGDSDLSYTLCSDRTSIEFSEVFPLPFAQDEDPKNLSCQICTIPINIQTRLLSSGELEIKADVRLLALITGSNIYQAVTDITYRECSEKHRRQITCYYVKPGDDLFDIGKKYKVKISEIYKLNPELSLLPGSRLYMYTCNLEGACNEKSS